MAFRATTLAALFLLPWAAAPGSPPPRVTFTERFPGSQPVFFQVTIQSDGAAQYRTIERPGQPPLRLGFTAPRLAARIFALTRELHDFRRPRLESGHRVGDMGAKTLAYDDGAQHTQQVFNFTTVRAAAELNQIFQGISTASEDALRLERSIRYDPLGVISALNQVGRDWEQDQISSPRPLLPVLRRAAANPNLMNIARRRARLLIHMMTAAHGRRHGL